MFPRKTAILLITLAIGLTLLGLTGSTYGQTDKAIAELKNQNGQDVGSATFTQQADGVRIMVQVKNLPPGKHGIHIHAQGKCDPPGFTTAGGHFNPLGKQHGLLNPLGPHAGDSPNLEVAQDGTGSLDYANPRVTLASDLANSLFKTNGTALVIHANPDDELTDPTGNSGGRIACGLILPAPPPSFLEQYGWAIAVMIAIVVVAVAVVAVKGRKPKSA